jgi:hypothetical protein
MIVVYQWLKNKFFAPVENTPDMKYLVKAGMKLWECNITTGDIVEADVIGIPSYDKKGNPCIKREVVMKPGCLYEFALNGENATRKFEQKILKLTNKLN